MSLHFYLKFSSPLPQSFPASRSSAPQDRGSVFRIKLAIWPSSGVMEPPPCGKQATLTFYAAWMRTLSRYQLRPDISHLLPHCLLKNARMRRQVARLFLLFLPISWFHSWNLRKPESPAFFRWLRHSFNFIHIWAVLNFTVSQQRKNSANTRTGAGLVSRVSVTERSYLSWTTIMSFSPCFKKRKDSCSLCHLAISVL